MISISASETSVFISKQSNITIIGASAFLQTLKLSDSSNFKLCLCSLNIQVNFTKLAEAPNLSNISSKYHEFTDIFSKTKAEVLTPHCSYDFQINLEKSVQPLVSSIYSLSTFEQEALKKFIEKNLNMGFIWPTSSPHGTPVLFIKKKDSSLCLCVDFCSLNCISKKDCYPLLLISDLLDLPYKVWVYTKINLHHTYHLVYIADGDEWKTAFKTHYG